VTAFGLYRYYKLAFEQWAVRASNERMGQRVSDSMNIDNDLGPVDKLFHPQTN
jgi:hypothetical protein